jgi:hypothetical protein
VTAPTVAVRERPIPFSGLMVRGILDDRKTHTRRVVKGEALRWLDESAFAPSFVASPDNGLCPYGNAGDRLWVRETWALVNDGGYAVDPSTLVYRADESKRLVWPNELLSHEPLVIPRAGWRPTIHMSRWLSRLTLEITEVHVERLQDITDTGGMREGWECDPENLDYLPRMWYRDLWNSLNAERGYCWDANPWVWVIGFRKVA